MLWFRSIVASLAFVGAVCVAPSSAATPAKVQGFVHDDRGAAISGATVTLHGPQSYAVSSDASGSFTISSVVPGVYTLTAIKPGFERASDQQLAIVSGQTETVDIAMHGATLTSLRTIAQVTAQGTGVFNTSTGTVNVISSETFQDQGQAQVERVLNEIPGVQIELPSSSGNGAVPGAITFPSIRGALSYETASLIDGHPVSVGQYGDYVTTFLNSFMFGNVEVVKGPGVMAPETNYAIGGTVNFRTKDPTLTPTPDYTFGVDNRGGTFSNFGFSDTVGRLGFVLDVASIDVPSAVDGQQVYYNPTGNGAVCPSSGAGSSCYVLYNSSYSGDRHTYVPGTASNIYNNYPLVACCYPVSGDYKNLGELVKLRYAFSQSTVATVSYLGSQTVANQNGNTSSLIPSLFTPGAAYTATDFPADSAFMMSNIFAGGQELESNNEPIFQAEIRTTIGNDTLLGRWYHANIERIIDQGNSVDQPVVENARLWGNGYTPSGTAVEYDGQNTPIYFYNFYNQNEIDKLTGYSLEYDHSFGANDQLTASWNITDSTTTTGTMSSDDAFSSGNVALEANCIYNSYTHPAPPAASAFSSDKCEAYWSPTTVTPQGAGQIFNTFLLRDMAEIGDRWTATISLYENTYQSRYATCVTPHVAGNCSTATAQYLANHGLNSSSSVSPYDSSAWQFATTTTQHFDDRVGLTYRASPNAILRASAGSAIAPPYIALLSQLNGSVSAISGTGDYLETVNAGALKPETAYGWDLGADLRLGDNATSFSGDIYQTNLFNAFITQIYDSGMQCTSAYSTACAAPGELFFKSNVNLANERYEGIEATIRRTPRYGFGYRVAAALQKAYAYNLPPCFYSNNGNCLITNTNLAIIPGQNSSGNALYYTSGTLNGFSNHAVPYANGNAEVSYRFRDGVYLSLGGTYYGKNNSFNEDPFFVGYATARVAINDRLSIQLSGDNIFNALSGLFPIQSGGVPIQLAGLPAGAPSSLPLLGATQGNVLGPATWRLSITRTFGRDNSDTGHSTSSSR